MEGYKKKSGGPERKTPVWLEEKKKNVEKVLSIREMKSVSHRAEEGGGAEKLTDKKAVVRAGNQTFGLEGDTQNTQGEPAGEKDHNGGVQKLARQLS